MEPRPLVLVDARNVLRSRWPNIPERRLVELARGWAQANDVAVVLVFDGRAPVEAADVVGTGAESADDWIAREASRIGADRSPYWLVTSDRELRARAGGAATRVIGAGSFAGELTR
jgi:rRNA-processing protein FCF1